MTAEPNTVPPGTDRPALSGDDNWAVVRQFLSDHIKRRWLALTRLSPDITGPESISARLAAAAGDAGALMALFDEIEQRVDCAFASRARRGACAGSRMPERVNADAREFKGD